MAGTAEGGKKAAAKNKELYGKNFYAIIGAKGGQVGTTGGFAANRELARAAGRKGGLKSRRGKAAAADVTVTNIADASSKKAKQSTVKTTKKAA